MEICGILFVMYAINFTDSILSSKTVFFLHQNHKTNIRTYLFLPESLQSNHFSVMIANFHMCGMMLVFSDILYMSVRYVSPSSPICLRCLMLTLLDPVELFVCFPIYVSFSVVYFMFECVGELLVECICYLCW